MHEAQLPSAGVIYAHIWLKMKTALWTVKHVNNHRGSATQLASNISFTYVLSYFLISNLQRINASDSWYWSRNSQKHDRGGQSYDRQFIQRL